MIRISLTDNFSTLDRLLMVLERDQMPFAIARALTDMAQLGKATITPRYQPFSRRAARRSRSPQLGGRAAGVEVHARRRGVHQGHAGGVSTTGGDRRHAQSAWCGAGVRGSSAPALHDARQPAQGTFKVARGRADDPCQRQACAARISQARCGWSGWRDRPAWQTAPGFRHRLLRGAWSTWARDRRILRTTRWRTLASADGFEPTGTYSPIFAYHARLAAVIVPAFAPALIRRLQEAIASGR